MQMVTSFHLIIYGKREMVWLNGAFSKMCFFKYKQILTKQTKNTRWSDLELKFLLLSFIVGLHRNFNVDTFSQKIFGMNNYTNIVN
jgi:hypothetical protein